MTDKVTSGICFWMASAMAPPRGYQAPPMGPVMIFRSYFWAPAPAGLRIKNRTNPMATQAIRFKIPSSLKLKTRHSFPRNCYFSFP